VNKAWAVVLIAAWAWGSANAATECTETVTQVFNHSNGDIYFATDKTCKAGWCQLNGNAEFVKRGYAMLLAAQLTGKPVSFRWSQLAGCTQNSLYASPDYMWTNS
jgi:hypothetical protein